MPYRCVVGLIWLLFLLLTGTACALRPSPRPPVESGNFRPPDLVELVRLDPTLRLDIRYATSNNFIGRPVYRQPRAFLQRPAAEAVIRAHRRLAAYGYGLLIFDGYRPWRVTQLFWDSVPPDQRDYVANPAKGSRHNRGCAVDCSLYDLKTGLEVAMPSVYDEPTVRSHANFGGGTAESRAARDLLRSVLEAEGFTVLSNEWWHFDYADWKAYPLQDLPFERLR
jgi:D-alanyl-D-alanine dipeptidase